MAISVRLARLNFLVVFYPARLPVLMTCSTVSGSLSAEEEVFFLLVGGMGNHSSTELEVAIDSQALFTSCINVIVRSRIGFVVREFPYLEQW